MKFLEIFFPAESTILICNSPTILFGDDHQIVLYGESYFVQKCSHSNFGLSTESLLEREGSVQLTSLY